MNYVKFLFKQILKNKLNYVPLVLVLVACLGMLFLNNRTYQMVNIAILARQSAANNTKNIGTMKQELQMMDQSDAAYDLLAKSIEKGEEYINFDKARAEAFENGDWEQSYKLELQAIQNIKDFSDEDMDMIFHNSVDRDFAKFTKLSELNLPYEDEYMPTTSTQFTLSLFRYILPTLLPVGLAYVLSNLYGSRFIGQLNINRLFPHSEKAVVVRDILAGATYALLTLGAILIPTVLISGIAFGFGNLDYPHSLLSLEWWRILF